MCRVVGYLLILAGVGLAGSLLLVGSDADPAASGSEVLGLRTGGAAHVAAPIPVTPITITISAAVAPQPSPATPVVVTLAKRSEPQAAVRSGSDSAALARDLQGELRRVGCYGGQLNGVWTPASRKAMKAFTDRVNAALPVDAPDAILLSLVKAHQGEVCGKSCPSLETLAEDGRCVPTAVLAHLIRKGALSRESLSAKGGCGSATGARHQRLDDVSIDTTASRSHSPAAGPHGAGRSAAGGGSTRRCRQGGARTMAGARSQSESATGCESPLAASALCATHRAKAKPCCPQIRAHFLVVSRKTNSAPRRGSDSSRSPCTAVPSARFSDQKPSPVNGAGALLLRPHAHWKAATRAARSAMMRALLSSLVPAGSPLTSTVGLDHTATALAAAAVALVAHDVAPLGPVDVAQLMPGADQLADLVRQGYFAAAHSWCTTANASSASARRGSQARSPWRRRR